MYVRFVCVWCMLCACVVSCQSAPHVLHSNHTGLLDLPKAQQKSTYLRAFALAIPSAWNALHPEIWMEPFLVSFRSGLE